MREVKNLAATVKEAIAGLKKTHEAITSQFHAEVQRAVGNADKLRSITNDLKEANAEVEASLGEAGSNFQTGDEEYKAYSGADQLQLKTDINGVTLNTEK